MDEDSYFDNTPLPSEILYTNEEISKLGEILHYNLKLGEMRRYNLKLEKTLSSNLKLDTISSSEGLSAILESAIESFEELTGQKYTNEGICALRFYCQDIPFDNLPLFLPDDNDLIMNTIFKWRLLIKK